MHKTLHRFLRNGLEYNGFDCSPEDLLEPLPDDHYSPERQATKRRRVEAISTQYLRGQTPVILTAQMRGPFTRTWRNPWDGKARAMRKANKSTGFSRNEHINLNENLEKTKKRKAKVAATGPPRRSDLPVSNSKQPTADHSGRFTDANDDAWREEVDEEELIVSTTSFVLQEDRTIIKFQNFGANADQRPFTDSSGKSSEWLRRRPLSLRAKEPVDEGVYIAERSSPNRSVRGNREMDVNRELYLAPPKASAWPDGDWESSASTSMIISSPVRNTIRQQTNYDTHLSPSNDRLDTVAECPPQQPSPRFEDPTEITLSHQLAAHIDLTDVPPVQSPSYLHVYSPQAADGRPSTPPDLASPNLQRQTPVPTVSDGIQSAKRLSQMAIQQVLSISRRNTDLSKEEIQHSAERCVTTHPSPASANPKRSRPKRKMSPDQPTFTYRKISEGNDKLTKTKPQHITFGSFPVGQKECPSMPPELQGENSDPKNSSTNRVRAAESGKGTGQCRPDVYDVTVDASVIAKHKDGISQDNVRINEHSEYSTQHAMMLAHMEFQESTFLSIPSETPRTRANAQNDTPQSQQAHHLSPIITPFSVFNTRLDRNETPDSEFQAPPLSTQDLFSAASPFAFSTVKKKTTIPKRSGLRFTVLQNTDMERTDPGIDRRSPTPPSDRIPLKERNVSFRDITNRSDKSSQEEAPAVSQDATKILELPSFGLRTSLDGGPGFT